MNTYHRLLAILALPLLTSLPTVQAVTCTDSTIPPSNPDSVYTINVDGTVLDKRNGLLWKQCAEGQIGAYCSGNATAYAWNTAMSLAANSGFAGYSDWRLPNVKELKSLAEKCRISPAINDSVFPSAPSSSFWSSSPSTYYSDSAWLVGEGIVNGKYNRYYGYSVRLVRAGLSFASFDLAAIQTLTFGAVPSVLLGGSGTVSATGGASGQPVIFSSLTPTLCTLSGSLVSGIAVGTCTIAANQAGSGSYTAAPQVTQNITISALPTYTLNVSSTGAANVAISAAPSSYAGNTPYSKTGIAGGSSITLTAPSAAGSTLFTGWNGCNGASGVFCTLIVNADSNVTASYKTLLSQALAFGAAPSGVKVGGTGFLYASASSGLAVTFSSNSTGICTVTGSTVRGVIARTAPRHR